MAARAAAHRGNLLAFGLFLAFCVAGNLTGFAAGSPMNAPTMGGGTSAVSACQGSEIRTTFDTAYDPSIGAYAVTQIQINGLDTQEATGCGGIGFSVVLAGAAGILLAERNGTTPTSGSTLIIDVRGSRVSAAAVSSIDVAFGG